MKSVAGSTEKYVAGSCVVAQRGSLLLA